MQKANANTYLVKGVRYPHQGLRRLCSVLGLCCTSVLLIMTMVACSYISSVTWLFVLIAGAIVCFAIIFGGFTDGRMIEVAGPLIQ